mmetsp:Transcript_12858/g.19917  ORF Transcript_12858/g.19917 Transcript_12858/m.19917 type:complete len:183 (-) Transcript_12858:2099-2647(-)
MTSLQQQYNEKHILVPMGCDFTYENAGYNFKQMDALIAYLHKHNSDINMQFKYSTPSEYLHAIQQDELELPVYTGDFFPFTEGSRNEVWSGYFSSRPGYKKAVKSGSSLAHLYNRIFSSKVLEESVSDSEVKDILSAKTAILNALGIMSDHNSISGDLWELVLNDNLMRLSKSLGMGSKLLK